MEIDLLSAAMSAGAEIVTPILKYRVTSSFGSPALWIKVTRHCLDKRITLPSLKRVLIAGAPVAPELLSRFDRILEDGGEAHTPYGATEALPVSSIGHREILELDASNSGHGRGTCVGKPVAGIKVRIIEISDEPIPQWREELEKPQGETGEIVVQGPWVTRLYFNREGATRLAKIQEGDGFWHRMGDIGSIDAEGRLWFAGRKSHRVTLEHETLFTIPSEAVFNRHPEVRRSALVGIGPRGQQRPVIVIEPANPANIKRKNWTDRLQRELLALAQEAKETQTIRHVLFHPKFPVDIRHNAKIGREKLARWAASRISPEKNPAA
jgi:acyl-CoA synthetase (AMP-forming)/AMP-acid ligase II